MKIDFRFINTKIGRRIFFMFALCALLPIICIATSSYFQISAQLKKQSYTRLNKEAKAHSLAIYGQLNFLEDELRLITKEIINQSSNLYDKLQSGRGKSISTRFSRILLLDAELNLKKPTGNAYDFTGRINDSELNHLNEGKTLLHVYALPNVPVQILMLRKLIKFQGYPEYLVGQIDQSYLWGIDEGTLVSALTEISILDETTQLLYSSNETSYPLPIELINQLSEMSFGQFDLDFDGTRNLGAFRLMFLQPKFMLKGWYVVLRQPASYVFQPMYNFQIIFPIVALFSLLLVIFLSIFYIRKSLVPLDLLKSGMQSIVSNDFNHRINLNSEDEFQELATHFNHMSSQLNQQFKTLDTRADIDRSILSSLKTDTIIETAVSGMKDLFDNDLLALNIFNEHNNRAQVYYYLNNSTSVQQIKITFSERDFNLFSTQPEHLILDEAACPVCIREAFADLNLKHYLCLPIFINGVLSAVVILGTIKTIPPYDEVVVQIRQMADQVGVALSNARLLKDLNLISWGSLRALARAVDAKSPWTAGHSERVAKQAVMIGNKMGLDGKTLENLRRAAFLHDIGKIGISSSILDKPDRLDVEEYNAIKTHPDLGARILEPIPVFSRMIPMIRQHHEKFAGGGYPDGVSGNQIDLCARILSVADVYDALVSDRPYRKGMPIDRALSIMHKESGKAFDPPILEIFIENLGLDNYHNE